MSLENIMNEIFDKLKKYSLVYLVFGIFTEFFIVIKLTGFSFIQDFFFIELFSRDRVVGYGIGYGIIFSGLVFYLFLLGKEKNQNFSKFLYFLYFFILLSIAGITLYSLFILPKNYINDIKGSYFILEDNCYELKYANKNYFLSTGGDLFNSSNIDVITKNSDLANCNKFQEVFIQPTQQ